MKYVRTIHDLRRHVNLHRRRVALLALEIEPSLVSDPNALAFLDLHDVEKTFLLRPLWRYYGGRGNRRSARRFYACMNAEGRKLLRPFADKLQTNSLLSLNRAERIADVVDRHCDPVAREEFAAPAGPRRGVAGA